MSSIGQVNMQAATTENKGKHALNNIISIKFQEHSFGGGGLNELFLKRT